MLTSSMIKAPSPGGDLDFGMVTAEVSFNVATRPATELDVPFDQS